MRNFLDLEVWKQSHQLVLTIYKSTRDFPEEEKYGLIAQMRRSASSIPMNIAEGCGRGSDKELKRFCDIAMGSASELEYQMILALDLEYIYPERYEQINSELIIVKKRLNAFIQFLKQKS